MSIGTGSMWLWMVFVTFITPYLVGSKFFGPVGTFIVFAIMNLLGFLFSTVILKETKGLSDSDCKKLYNKK